MFGILFDMEPLSDPGNGVHYAYTDGSSLGNPGPAGWAVLLDDRLHCGAIENCTNNVAEMTAVYKAFELTPPNSHVYILTDSELVIGWFSKGWKINLEPIRKIKRESDQVVASNNLKVTFLKVKGHGTDENNITVDISARAMAENLRRGF